LPFDIIKRLHWNWSGLVMWAGRLWLISPSRHQVSCYGVSVCARTRV